MPGQTNFTTCHIRRCSNLPAIEQQTVQAIFAGRPGFYVDVGANDPILDFRSQHLEVLSWTGLLVEPDPDCCDILRKNRTGIVVQMACSSPEKAGKQLLLNRAGPHSTLEDKPIALGAVVRSTVAVQCDTLDAILEKHSAPPGFELLSMDIEGHELAALSGFSFDKWQPQLVLIEDHVTYLDKHRLMSRSA